MINSWLLAKNETVSVWLNKSLSPINVLSISPKRSLDMFDVQIRIWILDTLGIPRGGTGRPPIPVLTDTQRIDFFILASRDKNVYQYPFLRHTYFLDLPDEGTICLTLSWQLSKEAQKNQNLVLVWTKEEYEQSKRPRMTSEHQAKKIIKYLEQPREQASLELLGIRKRVPMMWLSCLHTKFKLENNKLNDLSQGITDHKEIKAAHVKSISIEGFRGFKDKELLNLALPTSNPGTGLTIVVGENNAGKSTVWEAFDAIAKKYFSDVSISLNKRNTESKNGFVINLIFENGSQYILKTLHKETSETEGLWEGQEQQNFKIVTLPSRRYFQPHFSKNIYEDENWMAMREFTRQVAADDMFTGRLFKTHGEPERKKVFDKLMSDLLGEEFEWAIDLQDGIHGSNYFLKFIYKDDSSHTSEGLGDGIISLLYIVDALFEAGENTLIVIDEPELSLHPQLIKRLQRFLAQQSKNRQIVIFTHSPWLVSWDDIRAGAEIARVYKANERRSAISQVPREVINNLKNLGKGWKNPHVLGTDATSTLFLNDGIILVEGQEDVALLPKIYGDLEEDQVGTFFGWGVSGGDGNPEKIAALLEGLGFKKVVILLDKDKESNLERLGDRFKNYLPLVIPADDMRDKLSPGPVGERKILSKKGLFDADGKNLKVEFIPKLREILKKISQYLHE